MFIVLFVATSGCAVSETSSAPKEETSDAPKEAAQQEVDAAQLLADVQTLSDDSMEGRKAGTAGQGTTMVLAVSERRTVAVVQFDHGLAVLSAFRAKPLGPGGQLQRL